MSLKIEEVKTDHNGAKVMHGLFDGEPFRLIAEGGKWLFKTAKGWTHTVAADEPRSVAEARNVAYGAVAQFRAQHKFA